MALAVQDIDLGRIDKIVRSSDSNPEALIGILQDIQQEWHYLPLPALKRVADHLGIPENRVWAVATFYNAFTLEPRGRTHVTVCAGTACHVRGAAQLVSALEESLDIQAGHTTPDGEFSLETAHCLGACAMGPVVVVDEKIHGHMSRQSALEFLNQLRDDVGGDK